MPLPYQNRVAVVGTNTVVALWDLICGLPDPLSDNRVIAYELALTLLESQD